MRVGFHGNTLSHVLHLVPETAELNQGVGNFEAEFLIDFFAEEMGGFFYNRGLYDAETMISEKVSEISDLLLQLEKPVSVGNKG